MLFARLANPRCAKRRVARFVGATTLVVALLLGVTLVAGPTPSARADYFSNLAPFGYTTQSSTGWGAPASRATDRNTNGSWGAGSISSTGKEVNPWWQVDIGAVHDVHTVNVWNRTDCCSDRLSDYWVFLSPVPFTSNDPSVVAKARGVTAIHMTAMPQPNVSIQTLALARFVRIQLIGTNILSLAEVEVNGDPYAPDLTNFATEAGVRQSSTAFDGVATNANDGITDGAFWNRSVTHTNSEVNPWWEADLRANRRLYDVRVWNRTDCCADRLSNYWVFVSSTPFTSNDPKVLAAQPGVKAVRMTSAPSPMTVVPVNVSGQYVRVQIEGMQALHLAEVEINGSSDAKLVPPGVASQSSTGWGGAAQRAQDGSLAGTWLNNSVTATTAEKNPWWQVDLGTQVENLSVIYVANRTDCCMERLRDYWLFFSPTPFTSNDPAVTAAQPGVIAYHMMNTPSLQASFTRLNLPNIDARYVRIQIPGVGPLSLAEVILQRA